MRTAIPILLAVLAFQSWPATAIESGTVRNPCDSDPGGVACVLRNIITSKSESAGFTLSESAGEKLNVLVVTGAKEVAVHGKLEKAKKNAEKFQKELVTSARKANHLTIEEADIVTTQLKICPLYPFC